MSHDVRLQKLDSLARCIERLESKTPKSIEALVSDIDLQDIIMINLERLIQVSVDLATHIISEKEWSTIPSTMSESFEILNEKGVIPKEISERLKKSVGFRNIVVHEYDKINWTIVYSILKNHLNDFKKYAQIIESF